MTDHVKIYGVKPRIQYVADGVLTTYDFPFPIFQASDIEVYFNDVKQSSATYTVQGVRDSDGGSVVFQTPPAQGTVLTLMRNLSIERTSDFQEGGALRADILNDELDYQIACQQQIAENLNRSLVLPPYAAGNDLDLTLPIPSAGKAIVWNNDGTKLENSTVAVNDFVSTLNGYKTAAQAAAATATEKAGIATTKAELATTKAAEAQTSAQNALNAAERFDHAVSNCVVSMAQDIKLSLAGNILTLKAGSKIYVPNGNEFRTVIISTDQTITSSGSASTQRYLILNPNNGFTVTVSKELCFSGENAPSSNQYMFWYDTANNLMKYTADSGTTWVSGYSLPIGLATFTSGTPGTLNHIFNGLGYFGETVFALPGVKGLIPNGRNADGTLKNTIYETRNVILFNRNLTGIKIPLYIRGNGTMNASTGMPYDMENNIIGTGGYYQVGTVDMNAGIIGGLTVKTPLQLVNYYDLKNGTDLRCVVQSYKSTTNWYRIYSDGWVEQGGICNVPETEAQTNGYIDVSLLVPMNDMTYSAICCGIKTNLYYANCENFIDRVSPSVIRVGRFCLEETAGARSYFWEVKGFKA